MARQTGALSSHSCFVDSVWLPLYVAPFTHFFFTNVFVGVFTCLFIVCTHIPWHMGKWQKTTLGNWFSPSTIWVPGTELRSLGLIASTFTYWAILPAHIDILQEKSDWSNSSEHFSQTNKKYLHFQRVPHGFFLFLIKFSKLICLHRGWLNVCSVCPALFCHWK